MQPTDAELVQRTRAGDEGAFRELVNRHADSLYRMAYALVGGAADAEDVLQETFLGAFRRLSAFEGRSSVRTWLVRILMNQASKFRRSRRVRQTVGLSDGSYADPTSEPPASASSASSASAVESRIDLSTMLNGLSREHREVIVLRELEQMSYEEMAEALKVPRGTVESRLFRARQELKRRFAGYLE